MAISDLNKCSNQLKKVDWTDKDVILDLITEEDWTLTEQELEYLDWRFFKNYGSRYAGEMSDISGAKWKERDILKKLLRWYYKTNKLDIKELRGFIGVLGMHWDEKHENTYS